MTSPKKKLALRSLAVSLVLAAASTTAFAKPAPKPAAKPPASAAAPPTAPPAPPPAAQAPPPARPAPPAPASSGAPDSTKSDDKGGIGTTIAALFILGLLIAVAVGIAAVFFRIRARLRAGKGDGRPLEPLVAERRYDWEMRLSPEQENALLRGLDVVHAGGQSMYVSMSDGVMYLYSPRRIVSLYRLGQEFVGRGPAALTDPAGVVKELIASFNASESPGVLHLNEGWYRTPVDGLDADKFTSLCADILTRYVPGLPSNAGSGSDDKVGSIYVHLELDAPKNTLSIDLGRLLPSIVAARQSGRTESLGALVRPVLVAMSQGQMPGAMWVREPVTDAERQMVEQTVMAPEAAAA
jgi:hypothetical protein